MTNAMRCPFCNAANALSSGGCRVCGGPLRGTNRGSFPPAQSNQTPPTPVPRASRPLAPIRDRAPLELTLSASEPAPPVLLSRKDREKNAPRVVSVLFWPAENQTPLPLLVLENGSLQVWNASSGALHLLGPRWTLRKMALTTCAASALERGILVRGDEAGRVHLQELEWNKKASQWQARALGPIEAHRGRVLSVAARGSQLWSGGSDGAVVVTTWPDLTQDSSAKRQKPQVVLDGLGALCCLAVSPDGRLLAMGADDGQVQMWRLEDEVQLLRDWTSRPQPVPVKSLVFSPNGNLLVSCHSPGDVRLWAAQTGHPLQLAAQQSGDVPPTFAPNSRLLAICCAQNGVQLFDAWTGAKRSELPSVPERVQAVAFSPATEVPARETLLVVAGAREIVAWKVAF